MERPPKTAASFDVLPTPTGELVRSAVPLCGTSSRSYFQEYGIRKVLCPPAFAQDHHIEHGEKAGWLAPIPLKAKRKKVRERETDRRAGNKGCLPMSLDDYLKLLDWTGRQFRTDKRGAIPAACAPILERLDCSEETWFDLVKNFRKRYRNEAGSLPSVRAFRSKRRARRGQATTA